MTKIGYIKLNLKIKDWDKLLSEINTFDLYKPLNESYGVEKEPHLTIFYGLTENVDDNDVIKVIEDIDISKIDIKVEKMDVFVNRDNNVLKYSIKSNYLSKFNSIFREFPNINKYEKYNPHITIAFLNKNCTNYKKYIDYIEHHMMFKPEIEILDIIYKKK